MKPECIFNVLTRESTTIKNVDSLVSIELQDPDWGLCVADYFINDKNSNVTEIRCGKKLVGYIAYTVFNTVNKVKWCTIDYLYIIPSFRGRGIGKSAVDNLLGVVDVKTYQVTTRVNSKESRFWDREYFMTVSYFNNYYDNEGVAEIRVRNK